MKKTGVLILIGLLALTMIACKDSRNETVEIKPLVVMVSDTSGLGDQGVNDVLWAGCEKIGEKEDVDIRCLESRNEEEYEKNIENAVLDDAAVIVCAGEELTDATAKVAEKYPEKNFILVDGKVEAENVTCISFKEEEAAFLAGIAAAKTSETGQIGFIAGNPDEKSNGYRYGFTAGATTVNPKVSVLADYVGSYDDEEKATTVARQQREKGADVIFQCAGKGGLGVIDVADEEEFWVIGSEKDQSGLNSHRVLCSVVRKNDEVIYQEVKKALDGDLKGGEVSFDLDSEWVYLSDHAGNLPTEIDKEIEKWKKAIKKGKVAVPYDEKTAGEYITPEI